MMRPLLAIMAGLLCGLMGTRQAQRIREESATLHRWEAILEQLCILLQESTLSLPEAFEQAAPEDTSADALLRRLAADMRREPLTPLPKLYNPQGTEGPALARLLAGLSSGNLESRVLSARHAAQEIHLLAEGSRAKADQDARMWAKLGWIGGTCLALMLL